MRRTLFALIASWAFALTAQAQDFPDDEFSTLRFRPAAGPNNFFTVDGASTPGHKAYSVGVWLQAAGPVLRHEAPQCTVERARNCDAEEQLNSIPFASFAHLNASVLMFERAQLSLDLPVGGNSSRLFTAVYSDASGDARSLNDRPADGFAIGDPRVHAKFSLGDDPHAKLQGAAAVHFTVPLAQALSEGHFSGERTLQAGGDLIGEFSTGRVRIAGNLGVLYRPEASYLATSTGTELTYAAALQLIPAPVVALTAEARGAVGLSGTGAYPFELLGGLSLGRWDYRVHVGVGMGVGNTAGVPDARGFLGFTYVPVANDADEDGIVDRRDKCIHEAEDKDDFEDEDGCPEPDNDGDGMPDAQDSCPLEAEDIDGNQDLDGCPDDDDDGDGVPDGYDSCPTQREDMDGDRDEDGCPDDDTDRDGVPDVHDACPDEAEDTDGLGDDDGCPETDFDQDGLDDVEDSCPDEPEFPNGIEDDDGCPEPDQDGDAVIDSVDRCPEEPETLNGKADADGCPDGVTTRLSLRKGNTLVPTDPLLFEGSELIRPRTFHTLDIAAAFIERHRPAGKIAVVVYAPWDDAEAVTQGEAIRVYLTQQGVNASRIHVDHIANSDRRHELELVAASTQPRPRPTGPKGEPTPAPTP